MIDVKVYDLPSSGALGQTSSGWNFIELDSRQVVANAARRQTTPVHELFHRVQYAYGYNSTMNGLQWAVEGTAAWSQKYRASSVGDWMDRMNECLLSPDSALTDRSYDACHFWVYLGERAGNEARTIRDVWETWTHIDPNQSGQNVGVPETMRQALDTVIQRRLGSSLDRLAARWAFANYAKDFPNVSDLYDYEEDKWMRVWGARVYGPLASVSPITANLSVGVLSGTTVYMEGVVQRYGADYYVFNVPPRASRVSITARATASPNGLAYGFVESKTGQITNFTVPLTVGQGEYSYVRDLTPGQVDQIAVIIIGSPNSGTYQLRAQAMPSVGPDPLGGPLANIVKWSAWENLFFDNFFSSPSDPAVILNADGWLEVFVRGIDNALYHRWQSSAEPSAPWSGTYRLGGSMASKPVAARNADGRLEVFYRGSDNALWHQWQLAGGGWSEPHSLGGYLTSDPAVGQNADGRLEVFVRGSDAALYHRWQGGPIAGWSDWDPLGGFCVGNPTVARNKDGRLEVFVHGANDTLRHRWQLGSAPGWADWASMGGPISGDPVVGTNADGRLELFFRGADSALWHQWQLQPSGAWSGFHSLGGYLLNNPAAALGGDGKLAVFVHGGDHAVWVKLQGGPIAGWTDWFTIGGEVSGSPVALQYPHGNPGMHVRAADGSIWRRYQR
jgi:hypothetical protein